MRWCEIVGETCTTKPKSPMDADAWRRESERRRKADQRIADAKADCARKVQRIRRDSA